MNKRDIVWHGAYYTAGEAWQGEARSGLVRSSKAWQCGEVRKGKEWQSKARLGERAL